MLAPTTKTEFYNGWINGKYGNVNPMWTSVDAFQASGYHGLVAIRTKGVGTRCDYDIPPSELPLRYLSFLREGWSPSDLNISAMMKDDDILIQGNVELSPRGLVFDYTTVKKPMRVAFAQGFQTATGLRAVMLLKGHMDADSYDWLQELLHYESKTSDCSAVVELSSYRRPVGVLPHRNTIFWEVRAY